MSHRYMISPSLSLAAFCLEGVLSVENAADLFLAYVRDPAFDPLHDMVIDGRRVLREEMTFVSTLSQVLRLAPELAAFRIPARAVILVRDQTAYGYARMVEQVLSLSSNVRLQPVWSEAEVWQCLGRSGLLLDEVLAA